MHYGVLSITTAGPVRPRSSFTKLEARVSRERFKQRSPNLECLSGTTGPINLPDMTLLPPSGRLQNAIKYYTKVRKKTGLVGQRVE